MTRRLRISSRLILSYSRLQEMRSNLLASLQKAHIQNPEQVLNQVSSLDPTANSGKYLLTPWIINQIVNKTIIWPEDQARLQNSINWWWSNKQRLQPNQRQLNKLTTLHDLEDWQETLQPTKRETIREHKTQGAEVLYNKPPYTLLKITTPEAATIYGKGTKWCTTDAKTCSGYLVKGPLFILQKNGQAYIQYHLANKQVKQADDRDITDGQKQELAGVLGQAGLLDVGAKFALRINYFSKQDMQVITSSAQYSYMYASDVLGQKPFSAGEPAIASSAEFSYWYANDVLAKPFPAGEPAIASSAEYSYLYALYVLGQKPFPAGESAIASSAEYSYQYALDVLGMKPFPAGEPSIASSAYYSYQYARDILNNKPFPAGEPAIASSAYYSYQYARDILNNKPFPAGEPSIARDYKYSNSYASYILKDPDPSTWGARYLAQHKIKS